MNKEEKESGEVGCGILLVAAGFFVGLMFMAAVKVDRIEVSEPIKPNIKLHVKDNIIDTTYIYKAY